MAVICLILGVFGLLLGGMFLGRFIGEQMGDEYIGSLAGLVVGFMIGMIFTAYFAYRLDNSFSAIPYHTTPDRVYEIDFESDIPIYQTGEENSITFFTQDGKGYTENYTEVVLRKDGKNCIEVYGRDDTGYWWSGSIFKPRQKIVLHVGEDND